LRICANGASPAFLCPIRGIGASGRQSLVHVLGIIFGRHEHLWGLDLTSRSETLS